MATFGNTIVKTADKGGDANVITGVLGTCPEVATADSIDWVYNSWVAATVKCAIFDGPTKAFVAETEEKVLPSSVGADIGCSFAFAAPKPVLGNQTYYLVMWADVNCRCQIEWDATAAFYTHAKAYDGWPDPLVPVTDANDYMTMWCTYTPGAGGGPTVNPSSGLASTMAQALHSKVFYDVMPRCVPRRF